MKAHRIRPLRASTLALGLALAAGGLALPAALPAHAATATASCASVITSSSGATGPAGPWEPSSPTGPSGPTAPSGSAAVGPTGPSGPTGPCWSDVTPYPFGADGNPVVPSDPHDVSPTLQPCAPNSSGAQLSCYLAVTSLAFRSWNRGLAATAPIVPSSNANPYGVWLYNGTRWYPAPGFLGSAVCRGTVVLWAGKLDYWLIGAPSSGSTNWPSLCRFDGSTNLWSPIPIPAATLSRVTPLAATTPNAGAVTAGACYSWQDCWFFGSYGTVLHWDGSALHDESPDPSQAWLGTSFTSAVARTDTAGNQFLIAAGATSAAPSGAQATLRAPLPAAPDGTAPPQLYEATTAAPAPLPLTPATNPAPGDPYRTDLVAEDFSSDRDGWLAGDPAWLDATEQLDEGLIVRPQPRAGHAVGTPEPAPLITTTADGGASACPGPPAARFSYSATAAGSAGSDAYLWSTISAFPYFPGYGDADADGALAGGQLWPAQIGPGNEQDGAPEPVIVQAACDGSTTATRFIAPDPLHSGSLAAADRAGSVTAIAANADNDAWAATSAGGLDERTSPLVSDYHQAPHLYRLTDGTAPDAPAGDDNEFRPPDLQLDPIPPPPPAPPAAQAQPAATTTVTVKRAKPRLDPSASVYDVRSKLTGSGRYLDLHLTFKLRRAVTLGAQALRKRKVVATAPLKHFKRKSGQLVLKLDTKDYPTAVRFTTDSPTVKLRSPGRLLKGTVTLKASATPYHGRRIVEMSFQYATGGSGRWLTIGSIDAPPWKISFATGKLTTGDYDLRAIATDNRGVSGVSPVVARRGVVATGSP